MAKICLLLKNYNYESKWLIDIGFIFKLTPKMDIEWTYIAYMWNRAMPQPVKSTVYTLQE